MNGTRLWSGGSSQFWPPDTIASVQQIVDSPFTIQQGANNSITFSGHQLSYSGQDTVIGVLYFSMAADGGLDGSEVLDYYYLRDSMTYYFNEGHHDYYAEVKVHSN